MKLRRCARSFACLFVVFIGAAAIAQDQQVNIPSMKDNTLYEDDMGLLSNGAGQHMFVGTTNFSALLRRALIAFDIADNIPAGSTIQSVALTLNMSQTSGIAIDVDLRAANRDWGEGTSMASGGEGGGDTATPGDATWVHTFFDTQFWNAQGGDFAATPSATTTVDQIGTYTWSSLGMVADVQGWLDQPATNFGWGLIATNFEHLPHTAKRFDTKENSDPTAQPVLSVTYTPPTTEGAVFIPSLKDNTLYQDSGGMLSNGAGQHMFAGTSGSGSIRRALIAFDIADNIPAGSTIQSVALTLNMSMTHGSAVDVDLCPATQDWGEGTSVADLGEGGGAPATLGDATWVHTFFDTQFWNVQGGDFISAASATTTVDQVGAYTWSSDGMVADVQGWLDQPSTNFGWVIIATNFESTSMTAKRFDTKENADPTVQPVLAVTYLPPQ